MDEQIDELYNWIKKVIDKCDYQCHIDPCEKLIDIFEKKEPPEYLIKSLREFLKIKEQYIVATKKKSDRDSLDDRIYELYNMGHSPKEISEMMSAKYQHCIDVINKRISKK